jgi:hypothetical protein
MLEALEKVFPRGYMINGCIDFGGDYGQFFPENSIGPKVLIDISEKPVTGVSVYKSLGEYPEHVDLIMNCNVIEHMTEIKTIVNEMTSKLTPKGFVYIELPLDRFRVKKFHATRFYLKYLEFLAGRRRLFTLMDFMSGVFRQFLGYIPIFGIVKQSEHINFFSANSTAKLIGLSQSTVVSMSQPDFGYKVGHIRQGRLNIICR